LPEIVFVPGGAGVIGVPLVLTLASQGHQVVVCDLKNQPPAFLGETNITYLQGDLNNFSREEFSKYGFEVIIHLAATFERSEESAGFYEDNFDNNIRASHHLLSLIGKSTTVKRLVFASSYLVYDPEQYMFADVKQQAVSLGLESRLNPRNLIGMAKLSHEMELKFMANQKFSSFDFVIARIYRGYGLGSRDVISRWVRQAIRGEVLEVFGEEAMFDYIFSEDTARALRDLAFATSFSGTVDLGTGKSRRVADVLEIISELVPNLRVSRKINASGLLEHSQADVRVISEAIDWVPSFSLESAIPKILEFEIRSDDFQGTS
jgi:carbamoyl-phosphate synthase large subunit